jgi:hypothetical protein
VTSMIPTAFSSDSLMVLRNAVMPGLNDQVSEVQPQPQAADAREVVALLLAVIPLSQIPLDANTPVMPDMVRDLASSNAFVQTP